MSGRDDASNEPLERLLRRWGAGEASRLAEVGPAPVLAQSRPRERAGLFSRLARWLPLIAAAMLVSAALVVFTLGRRRADSRHQGDLAAAAARADRLEGGLADLRRQSAEDRQEAAGLSSRLAAMAAEADAARSELAAAEARLREAAAALTSAEQRLAAAEGLTGRREAELAQTAAALDAACQARDEAARIYQAAAAEVEQLKPRLMALGREANSLQAAGNEALAANRKMAAELARLRAEKAAMMVDVQRAYLGVAAGQVADLKARQDAVYNAGLIQRCASLRRAAPDAPAAQLLDRLEVILTRLALIEPYDSLAAETFADLIASAGLEAQIDRLIADALVPADVRACLFEAKLILSGVGRVG